MGHFDSYYRHYVYFSIERLVLQIHSTEQSLQQCRMSIEQATIAWEYSEFTVESLS